MRDLLAYEEVVVDGVAQTGQAGDGVLPGVCEKVLGDVWLGFGCLLEGYVYSGSGGRGKMRTCYGYFRAWLDVLSWWATISIWSVVLEYRVKHYIVPKSTQQFPRSHLSVRVSVSFGREDRFHPDELRVLAWDEDERCSLDI